MKLGFFLMSFFFPVNKHKPWIETSYHGVITENMDTVLLDPPLVALDKDAPLPYAGTVHLSLRWLKLPSQWNIFSLCHVLAICLYEMWLSDYRDLAAPFPKPVPTDAPTSVLFQGILYFWRPDCAGDACL